MPEFVEFPYLPTGDPQQAVTALVRVCRELPAQGEQFRGFRTRMKEHRVWEQDLISGTLLFLGMERVGVMKPSAFVRQVAATKGDEKARALFAERLWEINPLLFKSVIEYLKERVYSRDEVIKYIDSFAYPGKKPTRPQLELWLHMALGLGVLKMVGIALALGERGGAFLERAANLEADDLLGGETEQPADGGGDQAAEDEPAPGAPSAPVPREPGQAAAPALDASRFGSPRGRERPMDVSLFAGCRTFPPEVLSETSTRLQAWWSEQSAERQGARAIDFGFEAEAWMENAEELLYRIAVAAALVFRLNRDRNGVIGAFEDLDRGGVLGDLYYGTAPESLPTALDPQALMLASLIARRFAEAPALARTLEEQGTAAAAFEVLNQALGRGLLRIELFWMMATLQELGALRLDDLADYAALPRRLVRDTLYRLGFLDTPYAHDAASLVPAAAAARQAAGQASPPDEAIMAFALAAGCAYDCAHRRRCEHACRERAE